MHAAKIRNVAPVERRKKQDGQQCPVLREEPLASVLDLAIRKSSVRGASRG